MTSWRSGLQLLGLLAVPVAVLGSGLWLEGPSHRRTNTEWLSYDRQPPLAHTGGFGEPTCHACHFGRPVNGGSGKLLVKGVPETVAADTAYRLTVTLVDSMQKGGFMLSIRGPDGRQAGRLGPVDSARVTVRSPVSSSVQYAHHTLAGTQLTATNRVSWSVRWTAPAVVEDSVLVHVAANAANDDASEFGDDVYAITECVEGTGE